MRTLADVLAGVIQFAGIMVIFGASAAAFVESVRTGTRRGERRRRPVGAVRTELGRAVVLGLDFLVAAALLTAAVDPTAMGLGQLVVVGGIRIAVSALLLGEQRATTFTTLPDAALTVDLGGDPGVVSDRRDDAAPPPEDIAAWRVRLGTPGTRVRAPAPRWERRWRIDA
jgi:uncharacterized membrane protein